ncbi:MAG: Crp/Fnr family transcriptional regulator [Bacteroidota bacterium]
MQELSTYINEISPIKKETFAALGDCFQPIQIYKNDFFVKEGQYAQRIGFLKKGIVRAFFLSEDGKEYTKQFFVAPALVGAYSALLSKRPNQIAQQALTDCEILVANFSDIEKLYDTFHDLERLGRKIAEFYFLEKEEKEIEMALLDADKRYLILREKFPTIESIVPQYHIASYLGISPTQLSRVRRKLSNSI